VQGDVAPRRVDLRQHCRGYIESVDLVEQITGEVYDETRPAAEVEELPALRARPQVRENGEDLCLVLGSEVRFLRIGLDHSRMHFDIRPDYVTAHRASSARSSAASRAPPIRVSALTFSIIHLEYHPEEA
jgi:hypothetical protein